MPKQAPSLRCDFGKGYGPDASWGSTYNLPTVTRDLNGCAVQVQRLLTLRRGWLQVKGNDKQTIRGKKLELRTSKRSEGCTTS